MNQRVAVVLLSLVVSLAGCEAKAKPAGKPTGESADDVCARVADHGAKLMETMLRSGVPVDDAMCADAAPEQLRCLQDARTNDDLGACARAALTGTITISAPGGPPPTAEQRAACTAANDNWLRVHLATVAAARPHNISTCLAEDAAVRSCKLAATDPSAWIACAAPASK